ncbi:MAG: hypothetical protein JWM68_4786 [Verrucomicrobiales bacterium]|nr:hypothetical protein [Verrucomicrobiales bacterium]
MNGSSKESRAAKLLKGLKFDQEISSEEDLLASLPPGSQIQPGPYGGMTIVIPNPQGFMSEIPDFQGPWAKIQTEIYRFGVLAGCDGKTPMPRARTVSKKINAGCDQWIKEFYAEKKKDRWNKPVPKAIAPWLVARGMMAGMHVSMEETHGMSVPRMAVETYVRMLLIDDWNAVFKHHWHGIHPDASELSE